MKYIILGLFLIQLNFGFSQVNNSLFGKWVYSRQGKELTLILDPDSSYYSFDVNNYPSILTGKWSVTSKDSNIKVLNISSMALHEGGLRHARSSYIINEITDSSIELEIWLMVEKKVVHLRKVKSSAVDYQEELSFYSVSNARSFKLINSLDSNRVVRIAKFYNSNIILKKPLYQMDSCFVVEGLNVELVNMNDTILLVNRIYSFDKEMVCGKSIMFINDRGFNYNQHYYNNEYYYDYKKINLKNLSSVTSMTPGETVMEGVGAGLTSLGIITAVLSPLVSYNFNTKEFNGKRFRTWGAIGITSAGIGVSLLALSKEKTRAVDGTKTRKGKNVWYLVVE